METENVFTLSNNNMVNTQPSEILDTKTSKSSNSVNNKFIISNEENNKPSYINIANKNKRPSLPQDKKIRASIESGSNKNNMKRKISKINEVDNLESKTLNSKKSITTVKNSLYEALKNINKELNVKIHKNEQNRAEFSLMNFVDKDPEEIEGFEENSENETNEKLLKSKKEDGFSKRMSKKIDLNNVLVSFNNNESDKKNDVKIFDGKVNKFEVIEKVKEDIETMNKNNNFNYTPFLFNIDLVEERDKEIFEMLKTSNILNSSNNSQFSNLSSNIFPVSNKNPTNQNLDLPKLIQFIRSKEDDINNKNSSEENYKREIEYLKSELEYKNNFNKLTDIKKDDFEKEYKIKFREMESNYRSVYNLNIRIEKENIILKKELGNALKYRNTLIKKFNNELEDINKLSKNFFNNFMSTYEGEEDIENNKINNNNFKNNEEVDKNNYFDNDIDV